MKTTAVAERLHLYELPHLLLAWTAAAQQSADTLQLGMLCLRSVVLCLIAELQSMKQQRTHIIEHMSSMYHVMYAAAITHT